MIFKLLRKIMCKCNCKCTYNPELECPETRRTLASLDLTQFELSAKDFQFLYKLRQQKDPKG